MTAYELSRVSADSGTETVCTDLLDEERREMRTELIDDVSVTINETYTALYNAELDMH